ncbi:hypothetical protein ACXU4B_05535 [Dyella soli]|uniref:TIGR03016 family PEP-CTERM system-associated outer membrane protein n=1 Tax=Dyella soli TaxID=522319 RepID=A0A4R0YV79_9GAMM|nr:outer membrane beta-barrel protein [Dyella soli]TCI10462.1 hypothetical protein EZM97_16430 [Dyella soli]
MAVRTTLARSIGLALAACSGGAWAGQFDYTLYGTVEHTDNIGLTPDNRASNNVLMPGVNFGYTEKGSTVQANVTGNLEYRDYSGNTYDSQTLAQVAAQATWAVMPQRLDLVVQDFAGVEPLSTLAANSPNNQQQTNVIAVGPTLHFRVGDAMTGNAELHYINSYASKLKEFNSSRGQAAVRLFRDLSPTDQVSGNFEAQHVNFNNNDIAGPNYDRYELYGRYTSRLTAIDIDAALGWTHIDYNHGQSLSDPLVRLTLGWRVSARNTITLNGSYEYVDAAQDMLQPTNIIIGGELEPLQPVADAIDATRGGINVGNVVISADVYKQRQIQASYTYRADRMTFSIAPAYSKLDYVNDATLNQTGKGLGLSLDYRVTPTVTVSGFASGDRFTYDTLDRLDRTYRFGADLNHQWTPHWSWRVSYVRELRSSDAAGQSYHANEFYLTVVYKR